jgi:hypothetical protein
MLVVVVVVVVVYALASRSRPAQDRLRSIKPTRMRVFVSFAKERGRYKKR